MQIITVASDPNNSGLVDFLRPSSVLYNLNLTVLSDPQTKYESHRTKDRILLNYLSSLNSSEIVCFTDAYDTIFLSHEDEIIEKYERFDRDIVFSTEINCWPDTNLSDQYPLANSPYRFLNCGGFIGKAGVIKEFLNEGDNLQSELSKFPWSNQYCWTKLFLSHQDSIALDVNCDIFCSIGSSIDAEYLDRVLAEINEQDEGIRAEKVREAVYNNSTIVRSYIDAKVAWYNDNFKIEKNRLTNMITKSKPCHLHFNGFSKAIMTEVFVK